jgi:DNA-binding NarL/FixJ family response regulator
MPLRIVLADDHHMVREGCRMLLEREGLMVVGEAADGLAAVDVTKMHQPDVAVLDLMMPYLNGIDAGRDILRDCPATRVVLLTMCAEDHHIAAAIDVGIRGYVVKVDGIRELVAAIREVAGGGSFISPSLPFADGTFGGRPARHGPPLAPRERLVLQLVAEGQTSKEIAAHLAVSVKTAETYRARLMRRLEVHTTAALVRYAIRRGIIHAVFTGSTIFSHSIG